MRSAYYSRNQSYSRSLNAEIAESEGRFPRTRAAKELGVSVKSFDSGCSEAEYHSTEWHHIGKYANMVDYYDTNELKNNWKFWFGVAKAYKGKNKLHFLSIAAGMKLAESLQDDNKYNFHNKSIYKRKEELSLKYKFNSYGFPWPKHLSDENIVKVLNEIKLKEKQKIAAANLKKKCFNFVPPKSHSTFENALKYIQKLGFEKRGVDYFHIKGFRLYQKEHTSNYKWKIAGVDGQSRLGNLIPTIKSLIHEKQTH